MILSNIFWLLPKMGINLFNIEDIMQKLLRTSVIFFAPYYTPYYTHGQNVLRDLYFVL